MKLSKMEYKRHYLLLREAVFRAGELRINIKEQGLEVYLRLQDMDRALLELCVFEEMHASEEQK